MTEGKLHAMPNRYIFLISVLLIASCKDKAANSNDIKVYKDPSRITSDTTNEKPEIVSTEITPNELVAFARTLQGIPYLYASTDPAKGFDCSGFITYVFNHFGLNVPRSSVDFTDYGRDIDLKTTLPGDLILFTGTDSTVRIVGHMGIVEDIRNDTLYFIHSTSGKGRGVVISPLGRYYNGRFVKLIRVFPDSLFSGVRSPNGT